MNATIKKLSFGGILLVGALMVVFVLLSDKQTSVAVKSEETRKNEEVTVSTPIARTATVYKAPNCGCCNGYIAELKKQGYEVDVKSTEDMGSIKEQYGIEEDKQSCHTTVIGDYFVEGHVPLAAVEKLLSEMPDIDGIGLPGMPIGTPGMPGVKQAPYEIYQKEGNNFTQFVTL